MSPSQVCAQYRKEQAIANRTVFTRVHIGAAVMGKCIGFGPGPYAQVEALEQLLQDQNPANWHDTITKHQQLAAAERVQQLAASRPALLCALRRQQQLAAFDGSVDQHQLAAADADIAACLQTEMAQQKLAESASETRPAFTHSTCEATGDHEVSELTVEVQKKQLLQELAASASETRAALTDSTSEATADHQVSELTAVMQAATAQDNITAIASSTIGSHEDYADAEDSSDLTSEAASGGSDDFSLDTSHSSIVQSAPPLTRADIDMVTQEAVKTSNCAYGIQAEREMIKEFDDAAQQAQQAQHAQQRNYSWYKMGAPDVLPLGEHSGITFELGCQIDRALCHSRSSTAVPVEFKNRRHRFPFKLPAHECVQVQAQLQLCNAPMALLVERLQLAGEPVCQDHQILRQDRRWDRKLLPALHNFLAVFAVLATQQQELDLYFSKRACGQHHQHLKDLIRQQAVQARG